MSETPERPNVPPADELAAIRAQQAALEQRERVLRQMLISDPSSRTGNKFVAELKEVETSRPDIKALKEVYPEAYAAVTFPAKVLRIELLSVNQETGEITRPKRKAA